MSARTVNDAASLPSPAMTLATTRSAFLLALVGSALTGCATSVPHADTFDARMAAFVGRPQQAAYLAFGSPVRVTTDGADGAIHRWEWTRTVVEPGQQTLAQTVTTDTTTGTSTATASSVLVPERRYSEVRFAEVFTRPDGTVYHTRHTLRTPAEARAARNRRVVHALKVTGVATALTLGALALGPVVFDY